MLGVHWQSPYSLSSLAHNHTHTLVCSEHNVGKWVFMCKCGAFIAKLEFLMSLQWNGFCTKHYEIQFVSRAHQIPKFKSVHVMSVWLERITEKKARQPSKWSAASDCLIYVFYRIRGLRARDIEKHRGETHEIHHWSQFTSEPRPKQSIN